MITKVIQILNLIKLSKIYLFFIVLSSLILAIAEIIGLGFFQMIVLKIVGGDQVNNYLGQYLDVFIKNNYTKDYLMILMVFFISFFCIKNIFSIFLNYLNYNFIRSASNKLVNKNFQIMADNDLLNIIKNKNTYYGQLIGRYSENFVKNILGSSIRLATDLIFIFFIFLYLISLNSEIIVLIFLILLISVMLYSKLIVKYLQKNSQNIGRSEENIKFTIYEYIKNFREVYLYNLKKNFINKFKFEVETWTRNERNYLFLSNSIKYLFEIILVVFLGLYIYHIKENLQEELTSLVTIIYALLRTIPFINSINVGISNLHQNHYSLDNIYNFLNKSSVQNKIDKKKYVNDRLKEIKIHNLSFKYGETFFLKNISLNFKVGDFIVLKGKSGSGKTTFIDLISGMLLPQQGKIDYLGKNKKVIKNYSNFAYVTQNPNLFEGNLEFNLALGNKKIKKSFIKKIISDLDLNNDDIANKNFRISEDGKNLSGGQRQKISIGRAILQNKEVLLMDEITSGLDKKSETKILKLVKNYCKNKIVFFITHRSKLKFKRKIRVLKIEGKRII